MSNLTGNFQRGWNHQLESGDDLTKAYNSSGIWVVVWKMFGTTLHGVRFEEHMIWFMRGETNHHPIWGSLMVIWGTALGNSCIPWKSMNGGSSFWKMIGKPPNLK